MVRDMALAMVGAGIITGEKLPGRLKASNILAPAAAALDPTLTGRRRKLAGFSAAFPVTKLDLSRGLAG